MNSGKKLPQTKKKKETQVSIGYFRGMDVLRFICATGVIFHHSTRMLLSKGIVTSAESIHKYSGSFFLDLFFMISGFLISLILMKEYEAGTFSLKNFFMRRIIRIWPLYFLIVLIRILLIPSISGAHWDVIKTNLLYASTFTINFQLLFSKITNTYTILWSICIEEHIYVILPFLLLLFSGKFKRVTFFLIVVGVVTWIYFDKAATQTGFSITYFLSTSYFYFFGIGMVIACIRNGTLPGKSLERVLFKPVVQAISMLIIFSYVFNVWGKHDSLPEILLLYGSFGGYLLWASTQENFIFNLKPQLSRYLGNISYAMYITQIIVISLTIVMFKRNNLQFSEALYGWGLPCLVALLTIGLSTLLYYAYERPILKLKKKFTTVINK
jgi:peptidoglycan/LPS O-acetylase OafA/YrhL